MTAFVWKCHSKVLWTCLLFLRLFMLMPSIASQKISTAPARFEAGVGESVDLPCNFEELDSEDKVVVWKRGLDLLSTDEELSITDQRFQIRKDNLNYVLTINSLEPYDSGEYTCSVTSTPPVEITHVLQVNVPPTVKLSPHVPGGVLSVDLGTEVGVKCLSTGTPTPSVSWHRKGGSRPHHSHLSHGDRLHFKEIQIPDGGVYECRASNKIGSDAATSIEIRVDDSNSPKSAGKAFAVPWVETDQAYVPVDIGTSKDLSCRYNGDPDPTVEWFFAGFKINTQDVKFAKSKEFATRNENHSVTTFSIVDIHEDMFGDYTCRITNNLGSVERTIHLNGRPGPPALLLRENRLTWTVQSILPISEYTIHYRLASDTSNEPEKKVFKSSKEDQQGDIWTHVEILDFLKPNANYQLQVSAKNTYGYGVQAKNPIEYVSSASAAANNTAGTKPNTDKSGSTRYFSGLTTLFATVIFLTLTTIILS